MVAVGRLKRRPEFLRVAAGRQKWSAPGLVLQARDRANSGNPQTEEVPALRIGFTASAKVGNAVARNRARRRLRAAAAMVMSRHARPDHDYVLIARAGTLTRGFPDLLEDLSTALRRLGLYRDGGAGNNAKRPPAEASRHGS